jgi:hypothetical protein
LKPLHQGKRRSQPQRLRSLQEVEGQLRGVTKDSQPPLSSERIMENSPLD